jgi:hypothetical protein
MPAHFPDWEEAARRSNFEKAVSAPFRIEYHGRQIKAEIIKPLCGDAYIVQASSGFQLFDRRPTTAEIDAVRHWYRY